MYPHNQLAELPAAKHSHIPTPAWGGGLGRFWLLWAADGQALLWPSPPLPRATSSSCQSQGHHHQGHINIHIHVHWKTLLQGYSSGPHPAPGAFWWRNQSVGVEGLTLTLTGEWSNVSPPCPAGGKVQLWGWRTLGRILFQPSCV